MIFALVVAAGAIFVWWSSGGLPDVVASHFIAGGGADGFLRRSEYTAFMLALVALVPLLLRLAGTLAGRLPARFVNLPNKQYWLAPERKAATLSSIASFGTWTSYATLALLCAVHGLVVHANAVQPPHLDEAPLIGLVAVYLGALFAGTLVVLSRFFRAP
ncbi:MAG TPA: hypothetical protein VGI48_09905 [Caldimonas sp.]|jgi:hypothetical protein